MLSNYDALFGSVPIMDSLIESAEPFDGWAINYKDWLKINDCYDMVPEHNAYHIRYLAATMLWHKEWIGRPLLVWKCNCIQDGNHRYRAIEYLKPLIYIPVPCEAALGRCWRHNK
jgi:hypothetical protein